MAEEKIGNLIVAIIALVIAAWKALVGLFLVGIIIGGAVMVLRDTLRGDTSAYPFFAVIIVLAAGIWLLNRK
jgi:hypothetical protein